MARGTRTSKSILQLHVPDGWPDLGAVDEPRFRWKRYDGFDIAAGVSTLREITPAEEVIAVIPMSRVSLIRVRIPAGSAKKTEKMLPFLIEEHVVSPPEDIHAVLVLRRGPNDDSLIAVVDKTWLNQAAGELEVQGFEPTRTIIEGDLLNASSSADRWTMVRTASGGMMHFGDSHAVALDGSYEHAPASTPPLALSLALEERIKMGLKPGEIRVLTGEELERPDVAGWSYVLGVTVTDSGLWMPEAVDARKIRGLDLLGFRRDKHRSPVTDWARRLRVPIAIGAVVLGLHSIATIVDWIRLRHESATLKSEMEARFRGLFPEAKAIVDPSLQLARSLVDLRRAAGEPDPGDFVPLLAQLAPRLTAQGLRPQRMRYERGQLTLDLPVGAGETRESLEAKLRTAGLRVQVEAVTGNAATVRIAPATAGGPAGA